MVESWTTWQCQGCMPHPPWHCQGKFRTWFICVFICSAASVTMPLMLVYRHFSFQLQVLSRLQAAQCSSGSIFCSLWQVDTNLSSSRGTLCLQGMIHIHLIPPSPSVSYSFVLCFFLSWVLSLIWKKRLQDLISPHLLWYVCVYVYLCDYMYIFKRNFVAISESKTTG